MFNIESALAPLSVILDNFAGRIEKALADFTAATRESMAASAPLRAAWVRAATTSGAAVTVGNDGYADLDTHILPASTRRIDVSLFTNHANVQWDVGDGYWEPLPAIEIAAGNYHVPAAARRIRIKSSDVTAVNQARYCITAWA